METDVVWNDQIPEKDGQKFCVYDIAISPGMPVSTTNLSTGARNSYCALCPLIYRWISFDCGGGKQSAVLQNF